VASEGLTIKSWQPQLLPTMNGDLVLLACINGYVLQMSNAKRGDGSDFLPPAKPIAVSGWLLPARFVLSGLVHGVEATMMPRYGEDYYQRFAKMLPRLRKVIDGTAAGEPPNIELMKELLSKPSKQTDDAIRAKLFKGIEPAFTELALQPNPSGQLRDVHLVGGVQWKSELHPRLTEVNVRVNPAADEVKLPTRSIMVAAMQACAFEATLLAVDGETCLRIDGFGMKLRIGSGGKRSRLTMSDHQQCFELWQANEQSNESVAFGLGVTKRTAIARIAAMKAAMPNEYRRALAAMRASRRSKPKPTRKSKRR